MDAAPLGARLDGFRSCTLGDAGGPQRRPPGLLEFLGVRSSCQVGLLRLRHGVRSKGGAILKALH